MTIGTKSDKIFSAIILMISVNMIYFENNWSIKPIIYSTFAAFAVLVKKYFVSF